MPKGEKSSGLAGGLIPSNAQPIARGGGNTDYDSVPAYLYYVKAVKDGNKEAAQSALNHIAVVRGGQTAADLELMGRRLATTNLNDIAKRGVSAEANPQLKLFYAMVNENPNLLNHFDMHISNNSGLANSLSGIR
jgi:hypothetical protein